MSQHQYASSEELFQHIKDRVDDIDCVCINMAGWVIHTKLDGTRHTMENVAAVILYCDGSKGMIHLQDTEILINDGLLQRLRIPVRLVRAGEPLTKPTPPDQEK